MIPKRIVKWDTEIIADTIPLNFNENTHPLFDLVFSISIRNKYVTDIEVSISVFCLIFKGAYKPRLKPDLSARIFEFSTLSKFKFADPLVEEASIQFVYNAMVSAIQDFNKGLSKIQSKLVKHIDGSGNNIQYPIPSFEDVKPMIIDVWRMNSQSN